jgi:hypothetical protein
MPYYTPERENPPSYARVENGGINPPLLSAIDGHKAVNGVEYVPEGGADGITGELSVGLVPPIRVCPECGRGPAPAGRMPALVSPPAVFHLLPPAYRLLPPTYYLPPPPYQLPPTALAVRPPPYRCTLRLGWLSGIELPSRGARWQAGRGGQR